MSASGSRTITRRLFIGASMATVASAVLPGETLASSVSHSWRGQALGAHATIQLAGVTEKQAARVFEDVEAEINRLEAIFSLYRADSDLMRLNEAGRLQNPAPEMLEVLGISDAAHERTRGLFDPTVQPLFALFASHYSRRNRESPPVEKIREALRKTGFRKVRFDTALVEFEEIGMAMTLNGVAQGYITDKIANLIRSHGLGNVLLDLGEVRGLGTGPDGRNWRVGIRDGAGNEIRHSLLLEDRAIATSMAKGTVLDDDGRIGHIFHPTKGLVPTAFDQVSIVDTSAARADALSTAAVLMGRKEIDALAASGVEVYL